MSLKTHQPGEISEITYGPGRYIKIKKLRVGGIGEVSDPEIKARKPELTASLLYEPRC
jgi:hypothetical protein